MTQSCQFETALFLPFGALEEVSIQMTKNIEPSDPRSRFRSLQVTEAIRKEIKGILDRGTFSVILKEEIKGVGNILGARFFLPTKSTIDGMIKIKAIYIIARDRDRLKEFMAHLTQSVQHTNIRIKLALAALFEFNI